jgi:hypothetical protein
MIHEVRRIEEILVTSVEQTLWQAGGQVGRQAGRWTGRWAGTKAGRWAGGHFCHAGNSRSHIVSGGQVGGQAGRRAGGQAGREAGGHQSPAPFSSILRTFDFLQ